MLMSERCAKLARPLTWVWRASCPLLAGYGGLWTPATVGSAGSWFQEWESWPHPTTNSSSSSLSFTFHPFHLFILVTPGDSGCLECYAPPTLCDTSPGHFRHGLPAQPRGEAGRVITGMVCTPQGYTSISTLSAAPLVFIRPKLLIFDTSSS